MILISIYFFIKETQAEPFANTVYELKKFIEIKLKCLEDTIFIMVSLCKILINILEK